MGNSSSRSFLSQAAVAKAALTPKPGIITQGAYLWLELFFWENPLCQHQGLLGAFYL